MSDPEERIPRRPPSIKVSKWGMIESWLAHESATRRLVIAIGVSGLQVTAMDPPNGLQIELVGPKEEPADAAFRAISKFG